MSAWSSVADGLPQDGESALVWETTVYGSPVIRLCIFMRKYRGAGGKHRSNGWFEEAGGELFAAEDVTHWHPLPAERPGPP